MQTRYGGTKHPVVNAVLAPDPKNYGDATRSSNRDDWEQAMREEIAALESNGTWVVTPRPSTGTLLHTKWVYKTKTDASGKVERFKARLVACGNEQQYGVNYMLTFAGVIELSTCKIIFALVRLWGVPAKHGDIPNAYVKAEMEDGLDI